MSSRTVGSFEVVQEIGRGGMGTVYLARQPALDRLVVLKKIHRRLTEEPSTLERFQREARSAAAVHHHNVVAVHDCFANRGDHYIAQEFVDGCDLSTILKKVTRINPEIATLIALEVIRGLEEIHARGIIHRDLKPANILVGSAGEVKIADFGIALDETAESLTRPGTLLGSLPYMSPEQMLGERIDYRSDLFSFSILLYEMITGSPPFSAPAPGASDTLLERIQAERFDSPRKHAEHVPFHLVRLIRAGLRAKAARRLQSATEIRLRLERRVGGISPADCRHEIAAFLWGQGVFGDTDGRTAVHAAARPRRRAAFRRWVLPAGATAGVALVAVTGLAALRAAGPGQEGPSAPRELSTIGATSTGTASRLPAVASPALVRFIATPWAEVRLEDGESFLTPRAAPVPLKPGRHRIVFEHPRLGTAEYTVDLEAGEQRVVHHRFAEPGS